MGASTRAASKKLFDLLNSLTINAPAQAEAKEAQGSMSHHGQKVMVGAG